jgi:hypothetical protein
VAREIHRHEDLRESRGRLGPGPDVCLHGQVRAAKGVPPTKATHQAAIRPDGPAREGPGLPGDQAGATAGCNCTPALGDGSCAGALAQHPWPRL